MPEPDVAQIRLDFFSRLPVVVETKDVQVSSDAGILPIRQFDHQIGYTDRFIANYFRLQMHAAALNLLVRLRRAVADPPALTTWDKPHAEQVPVADPTQPVETLEGRDRRPYHNDRRRLDPLGEGHLSTWRTLLIKVAGEVTRSVRRLRVTLSTSWPHLAWFVHVCQRIALFGTRAQAVP